MKVVLAAYGSRGDIEPCAAIGRELMRRGHDVTMAVPPDMRGFVEAAGLVAATYGRDTRERMNAAANFVRQVDNPLNALPALMDELLQVATEKTTTLVSLAAGADLLLAGMNEQGLAANVADYQGIPFAALHFFPVQLQPSGGVISNLRTQAEVAQRESLGLPETPAAGSLEIQTYDYLCASKLADQWSEADAQRRPFAGSLTLELPTDADDDVLSWIAGGTPPIYFGLGSTPIDSATDMVGMVSEAAERLGERVLICSGPNDFSGVQPAGHVKIVAAVNHAAVFPACRAAIHHGGAGTTAAGMRAGIPTLILWLWLDQPMWADAVVRLGVGCERQLPATTVDTLVEDLRRILTPECVARCQELRGQMTEAAKSVAYAAGLLEEVVALRAGIPHR
ncbi:glycosyltransferase [Mycobacterium helveticum]|uniref:Glycosyltransferase n=1 Tax=Mycobacterium helveticum TaxID=2592811 RepID=A0A557WXQ2_9MYCO|nr:glycosyltransferase [Mycobacterium helveticum]TVS77341.1 glycosyltransferase [Mycobacterium helveticum]TVS78053.1 glycosyltransferase [Mycobacterium helveticum]